jgi:hypothetical protein
LRRDTDTASVNWWLFHRQAWQLRVYDKTLTAERRREWAAVFLEVTAAMQACANYDSWSAVIDTSTMRAFVVRNLGEVSASGIWEVTTLVRDILAGLTLSAERASELAVEWRARPVAQIGELRRHKNALAPLELIVDLVAESDRPTVAEWLAVRSMLP